MYQPTDHSKVKQNEDDSRQLDCKNAREALALALQNYTKVDIKWVASIH